MLKAFYHFYRANKFKTNAVLMLSVLFASFDYYSRLHISAPDNVLTTFEPATFPPKPQLQKSADINKWLESLRAAENESAKNATAESLPATAVIPELQGATKLDNLNIVVKATFISPKLTQRVALVELQALNEHSELQVVNEQQKFGRYVLKTISVHQLTFVDPEKPDEPAIIVNIFAGNK